MHIFKPFWPPLSLRKHLYLLQFGDSAVSTLNQVGGPLTDVARHLAPVALDEGLGLFPLHRLQDARQHEHAALQTVLCSLNTVRNLVSY